MWKRLFKNRSSTVVHTRRNRQEHKYQVFPQPGPEPWKITVQEERETRETDSVTSLSVSRRLSLSGEAPQYVKFPQLDKYIQCQIEHALGLSCDKLAPTGLALLLVNKHIVQPSNFNKLALVNMESDEFAMDQILPNKSILVYDYSRYNGMLLMAVNLTSIRKKIYLLTVTVSNGGPPTVKFTPYQGKGVPWDNTPGSGQIFSREPKGDYKNTKLVTKVDGGDCYALQMPGEAFLSGDPTFVALTATKWDSEKNPQDGSDFSFSSSLIPQQGACQDHNTLM